MTRGYTGCSIRFTSFSGRDKVIDSIGGSGWIHCGTGLTEGYCSCTVQGTVGGTVRSVTGLDASGGEERGGASAGRLIPRFLLLCPPSCLNPDAC